MGNLLRILLSNDPPSKCGDIFVDFESTFFTICILLLIMCVDYIVLC